MTYLAQLQVGVILPLNVTYRNYLTPHNPKNKDLRTFIFDNVEIKILLLVVRPFIFYRHYYKIYVRPTHRQSDFKIVICFVLHDQSSQNLLLGFNTLSKTPAPPPAELEGQKLGCLQGLDCHKGFFQKSSIEKTFIKSVE